MRVGPVMVYVDAVHGLDTVVVAEKISELVYAEHPSTIAIDEIGPGAGVVDQLFKDRIEGIEPVNVSRPAYDPERFTNRRAELYWGLRERFRKGVIQILADELLVQDLASIRYRINPMGKIQIETKEEMKRRLKRSPDRADMLAMLFDNSADTLASWENPVLPPSKAAILRAEMEVW